MDVQENALVLANRKFTLFELVICANYKNKNEHSDQQSKPIGENISSEEFCSDLLRFEGFCELFQPTSEIREISKLLIKVLFFFGLRLC